MARSQKQKLKLLYLMRFLLQNSDEKHPVGIAQMVEELDARGIAAERKSLYADLEAVIDAVGKCKLKPDQLAPTGDCVLQILALLQKENAFPFLDYPYYIKRIPEIFTDESLKQELPACREKKV